MKSIGKFLVLLLVAVLAQCTPGGLDLADDTKGGGTETTNSLVIIQDGMHLHGSAPIGYKVSLFRASYNPIEKNSFSDSTTVDSGGRYFFSTIRDSGNYNIFVRHDLIALGMFVPSLYIIPGSYDSLTVVLDSLGMIAGTISHPATIKGPVFVYLKGSDIFTQADSSGRFHFDAVPFGVYSVALSYNKPVTDTEINQKLSILNPKNRTATVDFIIK